jgi:hypothetical protein
VGFETPPYIKRKGVTKMKRIFVALLVTAFICTVSSAEIYLGGGYEYA